MLSGNIEGVNPLSLRVNIATDFICLKKCVIFFLESDKIKWSGSQCSRKEDKWIKVWVRVKVRVRVSVKVRVFTKGLKKVMKGVFGEGWEGGEGVIWVRVRFRLLFRVRVRVRVSFGVRV